MENDAVDKRDFNANAYMFNIKLGHFETALLHKNKCDV